MEHYFRTKALLFTKRSKNTAIGVFPDTLSQAQQTYLQKHFRGKKFFRFGLSDDNDIWASDFEEHPHLSVKLHYDKQTLALNTKLL